MIRVQYDEMKSVFERVLLEKGFTQNIADRSAKLFADNSADGVYSHGVYRFQRVVDYIEKGFIKPDAEPAVEISMGGFERWNGNLAMGNTNAQSAMDRAIELAKENVIGVVALNNTNHWMRGGAFGWQAADAGMIAICWTNTMPNMPAWGSKDSNIGNNPVVLAIPRSNKEHVVVDCALAQFSYGKIDEYKRNGKQLPIDGGYDTKGNITKDPVEIDKTWRVLPAGFWKGSGLSIAFDLIAAVLSGGNSVTGVGKQCGPDYEYGLSQVLIAIDPAKLHNVEFTDAVINEVLEDIKNSEKADGTTEIRYPGERVISTRKDNMENGIPVKKNVWEEIKAL